MRRRKAFILTTCSLTSESILSYSQYCVESIGTGDAFACSWRPGTGNLPTELMVMELFERAYSIINKDTEMDKIHPNSVLPLTPALPACILLHPSTGEISGTATTLMPATACTITAKKFTGGQVTVPVTISVELCTGTKSLITLVAYLDSWPEEAAYKLYSGKDTSGSPRSRPSVRRAL